MGHPIDEAEKSIQIMKLGLALSFMLLSPMARSEEIVLRLGNPDMEAGDALPAGWLGKFGKCDVRSDHTTFHSGRASLRVDRSLQSDRSGSAHQMIGVKSGTQIKIGGWVKSAGQAKVDLAAHFFDDQFTWNEFHQIVHLEGGRDWQSGSIELTVPERATRMAIGLYVEGQGTGWLDDVSLTSSNARVAIVKPEPEPAPPKEPTDPKLIPTTPVPGYYKDYPKAWMVVHENNVSRAKQGGVEVLFLGDSITQGWSHAPDVFSKAFGHYKTANFGIGGDKTGNVLWRIDHGEVDGLSPRLVVLMIGVNNLWSGANNAFEIAGGIRAVIDGLRQKLPSTRVLLLGVLPTGEKADNPCRLIIQAINAELAAFKGVDQIHYLDVGAIFLQKDGSISKEIMNDYLHPTPKGYEILANVIGPVISEMMK